MKVSEYKPKALLNKIEWTIKLILTYLMDYPFKLIGIPR